MDLADLRRDYQDRGLDIADVDPDPLVQFEQWFREVAASELEEPNAVVLATADEHGRPTARHVLVKEFDRDGFVFHTNYESRKGRHIKANPYASIVFVWSPLARQVCVDGRVERVASERSDAYFAARPRGSQLSAWASDQSRVIADRATLERAMAQRADHVGPDDPISRPPHWGGYRLIADTIEFWQGRPSRMHDRIRYERAGTDWRIERLAP